MPPPEPSSDPSTRAVQDLLAAGKWRKARDAAKELCKKDRERHRPLLVAANIGLVREMRAKGQSKEAETVLAYLKTIMPPEEWAALAAEPPPSTSARPARSATASAVDWDAVLEAAEALAEGRPPAAGAWDAIDALVVDPTAPAPGAHPRAAEVQAELTTVRSAIDATGGGRWEDAQELLRPLPRQSVFQHWKLFLRGTRCVFQEDESAARSCFANLPAQGALARAARALAPKWVPPGPPPPPRAQAAFWLALTGQPVEWADAICTAQNDCSAGRWLQALDTLDRDLGSAFPSIGPDLPGLLTDQVLPFSMEADDSEFAEADRLIRRLNRLGRSGARLNPVLSLAVNRLLCLSDTLAMEPAYLDTTWRDVIEGFRIRYGSDPLRDAVAFSWLGKVLSFPEEPDADPSPWDPISADEPVRDPARALRALDQALALDPEDTMTWLLKTRVLDLAGDQKALTKHVAEMVGRHPGNLEVLMAAALRAQARNRLAECIELLRKARRLNPLDAILKRTLVVVLVSHAVALAKKRKPANEFWDEADPLLDDRPQGREMLMLWRWTVRLRRSILESDPAAAARAAAEARAAAPSTIECLHLEAMLRKSYKQQPRPEWPKEWRAALKAKPPPGWDVVARMIDTTFHCSEIQGWKMASALDASNRTADVCNRLLAEGLAADPEGLVDLLDHLEVLLRLPPQFEHSIVTNCQSRLCSDLEVLWQCRLPVHDLRLRLAALVGTTHFAAYDPSRIRLLETQTRNLYDLALQGGLTKTAARAQALIDELGWMAVEAAEAGGSDFDPDPPPSTRRKPSRKSPKNPAPPPDDGFRQIEMF